MGLLVVNVCSSPSPLTIVLARGAANAIRCTLSNCGEGVEELIDFMVCFEVEFSSPPPHLPLYWPATQSMQAVALAAAFAYLPSLQLVQVPPAEPVKREKNVR